MPSALEDLEKLLSFHPKQGEPPKEEPKEKEPSSADVSKQLTELEKKLTSGQQQNQQSQLLQQLLSDPDISAVINAKNSGKKIAVVDAEQAKKPQQDLTPPEDFSKPADVVQFLDQMLEKRMGQLLDDRLRPLQNDINVTKQVVQGKVQEDMNDLIEATRAKHSDFDTYVPEMRQLNLQTNQSLTPEELYKTVKSRKGHVSGAEQKKTTETERPTDYAAKPSGRQAFPTTSRGLDAALAAAAERGIGRLKL